ncbi:MAG: ferredoxin, partial [Gemmatimonadaceae bacterium]
TINPEACKGCNLCVAVCPDEALITVKQDAAIVDRLRKNWEFWKQLPDTDDAFINVKNIDQGIGVLSSLLLKKENYRSMVGGDGACMGCGEKTAVHLVVSAVHALMGPRVEKHVATLDELIANLDGMARSVLASGANIDAASASAHTSGDVRLTLDPSQRDRLDVIARTLHNLKDLRWRYTEGPGGKGRARMGMANSTGCSSVWGATYPYNPYPFPWVNHLFQDAPSIAIGVFEGHMRKMADGFVDVRRAQLLLSGEYDEAVHEPQFATFDWKQFSDDEFHLCPPIISMGGDGAMLDIGFQNLSRLLASGKPIRVVVLDTQVYSNTGGQACTSGFTGQVADMSAYGAAQHGKTEMRKELALIAIAHRGTFVHQSSQASASHLIAGVLKGLQTRRPAVFNIYTPCPVEHGLGDDWSQNSARLALEARAFPFLTYDPDAGSSVADCLTLDGNPSVETEWPEYELTYVGADGVEQQMTLPLTIADWAATEGRFKKHFKPLPAETDDDQVPFSEFLHLSPDDREGKTPFIYAVAPNKRLTRLRVAPEIAQLAEERQQFWLELRHLAGLEVPDSVRERLTAQLESEFEARIAEIRRDYDEKIKQLKNQYPLQVARRLAEGLLKSPGGQRLAQELLATGIPLGEGGLVDVGTPTADAGNGTGGSDAPAAPAPAVPTNAHAVSPAPAAAAPAPAPAPATSATSTPAAGDDDLAMAAYIESVRCTTCNECTNLNRKMFAYNANKQAYIKDATAGTFAQLVQAAEKCPVSAIHPGTPLNPKEKDLAKWVERAKPYN